jgi:outer membrane protein assembly factor BamD
LLSLSLFACAGLEKEEEKPSAKELYEEAQSAIDAAEFQTAVKNLESLEAQYPFDPYAKQAQLDIAYAYYKFDELDAATSAVERFARLHPRDPNMDYVYYLKGLINFNRGQGLLDAWFPRHPSRHDPAVLQQAFNDFSSLVTRFPDSKYAGDAHKRMIYLRDQLAEKEIQIAEFYIKRKSWISSAKRAEAVIKNYPNTVWTKRALEILLLSYQKLGLTELATDTQKIIDYNDFSGVTSTVEPTDELADPPSTL